MKDAVKESSSGVVEPQVCDEGVELHEDGSTIWLPPKKGKRIRKGKRHKKSTSGDVEKKEGEGELIYGHII